MLKKFFISMLGSMAAFWLSVIIMTFGSVFVVTMLVAKAVGGSSVTPVVGDKILHIVLEGDIPERAGDISFEDMLYGDDIADTDLASIIMAIQRAADDKDVKGILLDCKGSAMGVASRGEVIDQLARFRKTGKWVYAYADNFMQGDYYVATAADRIYLNPVGMLDIHGLSANVLFYKDLLDKLGIDINVVRVGSFKSAVEPFMRMDMSEPSRLQTSVYLNQIWDNVTRTIADNRGLKDTAVVNAWADSMAMTWVPERYVDTKAVNELMYRPEFDNVLRKLMSIDDDKDLPLVTPDEYLSVNPLPQDADRDHVAVLYAVGDIVDTGMGGIVGDEMVPEIVRLAHDKHVKGLVLRVNSGGGSAFASEQIWKALEDFKATGRPFYVSMGDYAASGGYYISCGADSIFCDPSTLTGSIGIFGVIPNAQRLLTQKIGLGFESVRTNPNADFPSLFQAPTAQQLEGMQRYVDRGYDTFTSRVAQGRHMTVDEVKSIGGGRVWDGVSALRIGLVDRNATMTEVVAAMTRRLDLKDDAVVYYPQQELSLLQTILRESRRQMAVQTIDCPQVQQCLDIYRWITSMDPMQARMQRVVIY